MFFTHSVAKMISTFSFFKLSGFFVKILCSKKLLGYKFFSFVVGKAHNCSLHIILGPIKRNSSPSRLFIYYSLKCAIVKSCVFPRLILINLFICFIVINIFTIFPLFLPLKYRFPILVNIVAIFIN